MLHFMYQNQIRPRALLFPRRKKSNLISFTLGHDVAELREEKKSWNIQYAHIVDLCTDCPTKVALTLIEIILRIPTS